MTTKLLHSDRLSGPEHGSLHKPIHTSVAYGYEKTQGLADVFQGKAQGYAYARQGNPTVAALENKVTALEEGVGTVAFATGMAALGSLFFSLLRKGDHIVSSSFLFGNTNSLLETFRGIGLDVTFVDATEGKNVEAACTAKTKLVLVETIANPVTQVADLNTIGEFCREKNLIYLVDNTLTTPYLFLPKSVQATFSMNSLTKYIGGQGDALGGAATDVGNFDWKSFENILDIYKDRKEAQWALVQLRKKGLRDFGSALGPDEAHRISLGSETLALRMERACQNAQALADFLSKHKGVREVNYPGLSSHPQYEKAKNLFKYPGALLSFVSKGDCMQVLDKMNLVVKSSNLGDSRTLGIPVAKTIFFEMGPERRKSMGIDEELIRISVGIEDTEDLLEDFDRALG